MFYKALSIILIFIPSKAFAMENVINSGDTGWVMISTILVMIMAPGLAFFYSGMVNKKNVISTILHSYMKLCVISVVWILWGYTIAFGNSFNGLFGGFNFFGFRNVGQESLEGTTIPHNLFALFQGMFAVIAAAIITGSFAERVKMGPVLLFSSIWITIVYAPIAHWVWGGGWVHTIFEPLDFAGGAVVHINAAIAGLIAALYLGKRTNHDGKLRPHNIPLTILGASLLWFGWFGFNAGSALSSGGLASLALVNTNAAAAAGGIGWFLMEVINHKKSSAIGIISGSVAGLVSITPAAGFVEPFSAIIIGLIGSIICYWAVVFLKPKLGYDDSLDAFGIHGIGGLWGGIATGMFATLAVNSDGANGLFYGNAKLLIAQIVSSIIIIAYSAIMTFFILKILDNFIKIRATKEDEEKGLDSLHGERGYDF